MGRNSSRINRIARNLISQLNLTIEHLGTAPYGVVSAKVLWQTFGFAICNRLERMSPATLGEIVVGGRAYPRKIGAGTSMYEVHCGKFLNGQESGKKALLTLATTAVVAEITDILLAKLVSNACKDCGYQLVKGRCKNCQDATDGRSRTFLYQQDAPDCTDCGAKMVRNGACYKCLNCGATSGCS